MCLYKLFDCRKVLSQLSHLKVLSQLWCHFRKLCFLEHEASKTREGFQYLRVVTFGTRIPVASLLQMGVKKTLKEKTFVVVFACISSNNEQAEFCNTRINNGSPLVFQLELFTHQNIKKPKIRAWIRYRIRSDKKQICKIVSQIWNFL